MKVLSHISGSHCVLYINSDFYIDARKGANNTSNLEVVKSGQVIKYDTVSNEAAPAAIIKLARDYIS